MPIHLGEGQKDRPLSPALRGDGHLLSLQDWSFPTAAYVADTNALGIALGLGMSRESLVFARGLK